MEKNIIVDKDGLCVIKQNNIYNFNCDIQNKNIYLKQIINFDLMKLIYDLNSDIYESVIMKKYSEENVNLLLVMKHFFSDIGLPQRYMNFNITKKIINNKIIFEYILLKDKVNITDSSIELLPMDNMTIICELYNSHNINISGSIAFNNNFEIPKFAEKMVGIISYKMFIRVKQFIENYP